MPKNSLKSRVNLLRADGALEALQLRPPSFQPPFVALARERCLFERLDVAQGLSGRAAVSAARLHAEAGAPYQRYGSLITRKGSSFGIWWWDAQWVGEKLGGAGVDPMTRIVPETLLRAVGDGWRVVRASSGYEAQLWKNGFLQADLWRRTAFDAAAWRDFVRVQGAGAEGGENAVLMVQEAPWNLNNPYRRTAVGDWTPQKTSETAIAAGIALAACASLYFAGEAVGLRKDTADMKAETVALEAKAPTAGGANSASGLSALRSALDGPDPMVMLREAQEKIQPFGHKLASFETTRGEVKIVLPREASEDVEVMARELADSPYFADVRPSLDPESGMLTIAMTAKGAKPKARPRASGGAAPAIPGIN